MNIGELFVTLGAKTDSSWKEALTRIRQIGEFARRSSNEQVLASKAATRQEMADFRAVARMAREVGIVKANAALEAARAQVQASKMAARAAVEAERAQERAWKRMSRSKGMPDYGSGGSYPWDAGKRGRGHAAIREAFARQESGGGTVNLRGGATLPGDTGPHSTFIGRLMNPESPDRSAPVENSVVNRIALRGQLPEDKREYVDTSAPLTWRQKIAARWQRARGTKTASGGGGGGGGRGGRGGRGGNLLSRLAGGGGGGDSWHNSGVGEIASFRRVVMGAGIYQGAQAFGELADTYTNLMNRLGGVTSSQEEANKSFERLRGIARDTRASLESTTEGYVRIKNATAAMKISDEDRYKLIERINMAMAQSGASTSEMHSGMMQLTQAFSKGKLDGDEFRAMAENTPIVLKVLQTSLKKTEGQIREMSKAGQLTREVMVKAFLGADQLKAGMANLKPTFSSEWQKFKDNLMVTFGRMAQDQNLVAKFTELLNGLSWAVLQLVQLLPPLVNGIVSFFDALKEGEPWAYALAATIGLSLLPTLLRLAVFPFVRIATLFKLLGGAIGFFSDAANFAVGGAGGLTGVLGALKGPLLAMGGIATGVGAAYALNELTGGSINEGKGGVMALAEQALASGKGTPSANPYASMQGSAVNMGGVNITVNAQDGTDAGNKIVEAMKNQYRQAGASFDR